MDRNSDRALAKDIDFIDRLCSLLEAGYIAEAIRNLEIWRRELDEQLNDIYE